MKIKTLFHTAVLGMTSLLVLGDGAFASAAGSREIPFSALDGVRVGNAQDDAGLTGVTAPYFPDGAMGYAACENALREGRPVSGSVGAGTGATVGKLCGMQRSMKSGVGYAAVQIGELKLGAMVDVNALGDVYSTASGKKIAGLTNEDRTGFVDSVEELYRISAPQDLFSRSNTTIGAIVTNGKFDKAQLTRIAAQASNAYARAIRPVGTLADGDTVYASSCGTPVAADVNMVGTLAAEVMAKAIEDAIASSKMEDTEYLSHCLTLPAR